MSWLLSASDRGDSVGRCRVLLVGHKRVIALSVRVENLNDVVEFHAIAIVRARCARTSYARLQVNHAAPTLRVRSGAGVGSGGV